MPSPSEERRARMRELRGSRSPSKSWWDWANTPLLPQIADLGKRAGDWISEPELDDEGITPYLKGFFGGATEAAGNVAAGFTSPLNIGLGVVTGGAGTAARTIGRALPAVRDAEAALLAARQAGRAAEIPRLVRELEAARKSYGRGSAAVKSLRATEATAGLGFGAEGARTALDPKKSVAERLAGVAQAAGGAAGVGAGVRGYRAVPPNVSPEARLVQPLPTVEDLPGEVLRIEPPPRYEHPPEPRKSVYGIDPEVWHDRLRSDPLYATIPDRLYPPPPNEILFESMLPSRARQLTREEVPAGTSLGAVSPGTPTKNPKIPGAKPRRALPGGTQSRLRKMGLTEEEIGRLDIKQANELIKAREAADVAAPVGPKAPAKTLRPKELGPKADRQAAIDKTLEAFKSGRPYAEFREVDLRGMAKAGDRKAQEELALRSRALGGFNAEMAPGLRNDVLGTVEPPPNVGGTTPKPEPPPIPLTERPYATLDGQRLRALVNQGDEAARMELAGRTAGVVRREPTRGDTAAIVDPIMAKNDMVTRVEEKLKPRLVKNNPELPALESQPDWTGISRETPLGNEKGFIGGGKKEPKRPPQLKQVFDEEFADWVNRRRATKIEGILKKKEFQDLDDYGMEGIIAFQDGYRSGKFNDVQKYFDEKHADLTSKGIKFGFKENYLPQLWDNPVDEILQVQRRLGLKPRFTLESVLENYRAGLELGLKPKFNKISDLVEWYESTAQKAVADRQFFDFLKSMNLIKPRGKAPAHWESLDPDHFPVQKFKAKGKEYQGVLVAPPDVARAVNNYLRIPPSELDFRKPGALLAWAGDKASLSKNFALSAGVPGTAFNAHGFNILARNIMAKGLRRGGPEALKFMFNPRSAGKFVDENLGSAPFAVKHGLTLTTEGHEMGVVGSTNLAGKALQGFLKVQGKLFEDPLFQNMIPALKLKHFNGLYDDLRKQGLGEREAARTAATTTNDLYGGINWEEMQRSRDFGNVARALVIAPDWLASNFRLGKGMVNALRDPKSPQGRVYANFAKNLLLAYLSADVVNYAVNGHHMWDNEPGHALDIQLGKSGKKIRWFRPFGTAADFFRLPFDAAASTLKGDLGQTGKIMKYRASIPTHVATNLLMNVDDFGRPMFGKDAYGNKIPMGKQVLSGLGEVSEVITPPYVQSLEGFASGRLNPEQALAGTVESPVRYSTPSQKHKRRRSGFRRR